MLPPFLASSDLYQMEIIRFRSHCWNCMRTDVWISCIHRVPNHRPTCFNGETGQAKGGGPNHYEGKVFSTTQFGSSEPRRFSTVVPGADPPSECGLLRQEPVIVSLSRWANWLADCVQHCRSPLDISLFSILP